MSIAKHFEEIEKVLAKIGYKIIYAVYDEDKKILDFKAKSTVTPVIFPNFKNDAEALKEA